MIKFVPWLSLFVIGCSVSKNPLRKEVKALQKGIIKDDSSYVYALPYENDTRICWYKGISVIFLIKRERPLILK